MQVGAAAFRAYRRCALGNGHLAAVITIISRNPVSPPELTGNTPVTDALKPVQIGLSEALRNEFKSAGFKCLYRRFRHLFHLDKPLRFYHRLYGCAAAVVGTYLPEVAVQTSALERRADEAERETDKMKKVQYMEHYIGEEFEGVISGVTNWGFYVELPNTVEGLVHVNELRGDYFVFDEAHYELVGEMTRKTYKLGQTIRVRVTACDRYARTIDFMPAVYWK